MVWETNGDLPWPVRDRCNSSWNPSSHSSLQRDGLKKIKAESAKLVVSTPRSGPTVSTFPAIHHIICQSSGNFHPCNHPVLAQLCHTVMKLEPHLAGPRLLCSVFPMLLPHCRVLDTSRGITALSVPLSPYSFTSEFNLPKGRNSPSP